MGAFGGMSVLDESDVKTSSTCPEESKPPLSMLLSLSSALLGRERDRVGPGNQLLH